MDVKKYLNQNVIDDIFNAILEADENEVFFTGQIDENGIVTSVKVGSRGNECEVPVNFNDSKSACVLIHNHPSGNLTPSSADLNVAENMAQNGVGFYIINNNVNNIYVVVEPIKTKTIHKLNNDDSASLISNGGKLSTLSNFFEEREGQIELLRNICDVFNENKIGVFEAGTGVGKSFAYLIPSCFWALENNERVVVSTGTINLQQQLCEKDIPIVERIIGKKINFVLMKGRQNYVCLRRLTDASSVLDLFENESDEIKKIAQWAKESPTGSKSDLSFMPSENVWSKINSESDACMGMRCPYHNNCFVMKIRKEASGANLIVVNHHLLFADIESRLSGAGYDDAAVLPPYRHIIFDEAHGIENAATSFFSENITKFKINKLINQMYRKRKNSTVGHLCSLAILSSNEEKLDSADGLIADIKNDIFNLEVASKDLLSKDYTKRLYDSTKREFGPVLVLISKLSSDLASFAEIVRVIMEGISDEDKDVPFYWESKIVLRRLDDCVLLLKDFNVWDEKRDFVFWIQQKKLPPDMIKDNNDGIYFIFNKTPLDISSLMAQGVYEPMNSIVFTSATLKTGKDFKYWASRTGINYVECQRVVCKEFSSPFPYEKNMIFAVPRDAPLPEKMEYQQWIEMALPKLILAAQGRTLILFTSYESLKSAYYSTKSTLVGFSGRIMRQGEDDSSKLLDSFRKEKESVLFATDSFWQGVDVPGESLSQVIIVKLPFSVPSDPIFVARSEAIENKGGNSFMELSVPEAIIKFRQGIGRLIRKSDDKGVVVVFDRRIYEKPYGSIFLASMPNCQKIYEPFAEISKKVNSFIFSDDL